MKKTKKILLLALITMFLNLAGVKAETVAKIGDNEYQTLDAAIEASTSGDTIELINDAKLETTISLNNNLTINGNNKTITILRLPSDDGELSIYSNITLNNITVNHSNTNTKYKSWSIYMSSDSILNLNNTTYNLTNHGLYASPNAVINLNNSTLTAKNMDYTAFMQGDIKNTYAYINLNNESLLEIDNITKENGTNWFSIKADNSRVSVTNCAKQGLVGGRLELLNKAKAIYDKTKIGFTLYEKDYIIVNEGTELSITNSKENAIWQWGGLVEVKNKGNLIATSNGTNFDESNEDEDNATINNYNSKGNGTINFEDTANVKINNNYLRAITNKGNAYIGSNTEIMNNGLIINDNQIPNYGGGIYNKGIININTNVKLYNNHAKTGGDDIYNTGTITFDKVGEDWILDDCNHKINAWYDDKEETRWEAHNRDNLHIEKVESGSYEIVLAIKAAHDNMGTLVINYVDSDNNKLTEEIISTKEVGTKYETEKKDFEGYTFITVEGETSGEYDFDTTYVTYYYDKNIGTGDITPPKTGLEPSTINTTKVEIINIYKKEEK